MGTRSRALSGGAAATIALVVVVVAIGALVTVDLTRAERVPENVSVDGVELGGLTEQEAAAAIRDRLAEPLERRVVAERGDREFTLAPRQSEIEVDVEATVDLALEQGRGGVPGLRILVGAVDGPDPATEIDPRIRYSEDAVDGFAGRVADELDLQPRDAELDVSVSGLDTESARAGFETDRGTLRQRLAQALESPDRHRIEVPGERLEPEVTIDDLAERYPDFLIVDREGFELHHFASLELEATYRISVGDIGQQTPPGRYDISNKAIDPTWYVPEDAEWAGDRAGEVIPPGPENPIKSRWLGIEDGIGIHGTDEEDSIGERASAGCIRMLIPEVEELYDRIPVGTPVHIG